MLLFKETRLSRTNIDVAKNIMNDKIYLHSAWQPVEIKDITWTEIHMEVILGSFIIIV